MHSPLTRRAVLAVTLVAAVLMGIAFRGSLPLHAQQPSNDKLKQLLEERHTTLESAVELARRAHAQGEASVVEVYQAQAALLRAELESSETPKDRVLVLEKVVKLAAEKEQTLARGIKEEWASTMDATKAKIERIEAEIALERARRN